MRIPLFTLLFLLAAARPAEPANPISLSSHGWTVTADADECLITVTQEKLGTVIKNVRLNLEAERGPLALKSCSFENQPDGRLSIFTAQPSTAWIFEMQPNLLKISSTRTEAVLTAEAPASPARRVARLVDPQGFPVTWVGTNAGSSWGASETRRASFLPSRNPECMYFSLGQVSGRNLHSLFDRSSGAAIDFSDRTSLRRNPRDPDRLDLVIPVPGNTLIRILPDYFTKTLGAPFYVPFDDARFPAPPIVWGSWSSYYQDVTEQDIVRNADWIAAHLKAYGLNYVLLDDGYDRGPHGEHEWIANWDAAKFPHGGKWLAQYIKSKGLHAGLWLVPNSYAGAAAAHPEWYLRDASGKFILDYDTPALDFTHPEVRGFLKTLFTTLDEWGFDYYKLDGEFSLPAYSPRVDRSRLYDKTADPVLAYRDRLKLIRDTVGPGVMLEGSPEGTPLDGIGYFTTYWNGYDDYNGWQGMCHVLSSINDNAFLNHLAFYLIAGEGIDVSPWMSMEEAKKKRPPHFIQYAEERRDHEAGFGLTPAEAHTLAAYLALTGGVYSVASVMPELPEERTRLLKQTLPTLPIFPIDLFSRGSDMTYDRFQQTNPDLYIHNYPDILDLKVNAESGVYDVVALSNWRRGTASRTLSFAGQLGLDPSARYIAFDFWNQKLLGVFKDQMTVPIEPHDTRVFLVHPLLARPQLVGISRHISGAYSVSALRWDAAQNRLSGSAATVPGDDYALFIYLPAGLRAVEIRAAVPGQPALPIRREITQNMLKVSFPGQSEAVNWEVKFAR
jgi:hypothetical protein